MSYSSISVLKNLIMVSFESIVKHSIDNFLQFNCRFEGVQRTISDIKGKVDPTSIFLYMADVFDKKMRSYVMSRIKGKDTKPEMVVRRFLHANGFRYRLHVKDLPGKPDIVLKKLKTIIDVRGCFWHGHKNCKYGEKIKSESIGITEKVRSAIQRDKVNEEKWRQLGWRVITIWDSCELEVKRKRSEKRERILIELLKKLLQKVDTSN
jgi:DNA mismatch endonuclease, patch repair protein